SPYKDSAPTAFYTLSLHDALPISLKSKHTGIRHFLFEKRWHPFFTAVLVGLIAILAWPLSVATGRVAGLGITTPSANILQFAVRDRKSTRLNSSHVSISYAVFCLK